MDIINQEVKNYIEGLNKSFSSDLLSLIEHAKENGYPIIPKDVANFLASIINIKKPKQILEIGSCVGFSSIFMALHMPKYCHITTIEKDEQLANQAKINFEKFKMLDKITLIKGDALEILKNINTKFDFIFLDAAKGQYINLVNDILRILEIDGVLVADDVLVRGIVTKQNQKDVDKRWRTIYNRMREFLHILHNTDGVLSTIIPVDDGILLSTKIKEIE